VARLDGVPLQALACSSSVGTNAVAVSQAVYTRRSTRSRPPPEGMKVQVLFDQTVFIEESVHELELELGMAVILTAIVCWLFLGSLSSTMNVVLAIPMSLLGTVAVVYFLGFTLNTFTLLGLSLAVVSSSTTPSWSWRTSSDTRRWVGPVKARGDGTKEIAFAALAADAGRHCIFLPVIFMSGVIGKFFFQFGITLSVWRHALVISRPLRWRRRAAPRFLNASRENRGTLGRIVDRAFNRLSARMPAARTAGSATGQRASHGDA